MSVRSGSWSQLGALLSPLRAEAFIREQQVPEELEWDEDDATALHFVAEDEAGQVTGCARLLPSGQIGRMAVARAFRRRGWGSLLLVGAESAARDKGMAEVFLHAQVHAIPFYSRHGYIIESEIFMDAGIPHRTMRKTL